MRATVDRPVRISGALFAIVIMSIVAIGLKVAEMLEQRPHLPACKGCGRSNVRIDATGSLCDDCRDGAA